MEQQNPETEPGTSAVHTKDRKKASGEQGNGRKEEESEREAGMGWDYGKNQDFMPAPLPPKICIQRKSIEWLRDIEINTS